MTGHRWMNRYINIQNDKREIDKWRNSHADT